MAVQHQTSERDAKGLACLGQALQWNGCTSDGGHPPPGSQRGTIPEPLILVLNGTFVKMDARGKPDVSNTPGKEMNEEEMRRRTPVHLSLEHHEHCDQKGTTTVISTGEKQPRDKELMTGFSLDVVIVETVCPCDGGTRGVHCDVQRTLTLKSSRPFSRWTFWLDYSDYCERDYLPA